MVYRTMALAFALVLASIQANAGGAENSSGDTIERIDHADGTSTFDHGPVRETETREQADRTEKVYREKGHKIKRRNGNDDE